MLIRSVFVHHVEVPSLCRPDRRHMAMTLRLDDQ